MTNPTFLPAWRLAELIRSGAISCLELLDHYIARVERLDGKTNAVVVRDFDRARERARKLDGQRKDGRATPLFGVPMTVKESFNLAGLPTTWGHEAQRGTR
jgi:amidase